MNYLLTEDEYKNLVPKDQAEKAENGLKDLVKLFVMHTDMPCPAYKPRSEYCYHVDPKYCKDQKPYGQCILFDYCTREKHYPK